MKESYNQPRKHIKKQRHFFVHKGPSSQGYSFSSSHVWMWELDYTENWVPKNWCFWTVVLEKTLESPLNCKVIQPVHPKGDQSWVFIGRTDLEAETPIIWPPGVKSWLIWKDPGAGKDWRQEEMGTTEGEMVGWHHRHNGHEFEQAPGVGDGQGGLACCGSWGHKESDTTERLTWTEESLMTWESVHALIWSDVTPCTQFDYWKIYVEILRENISGWQLWGRGIISIIFPFYYFSKLLKYTFHL